MRHAPRGSVSDAASGKDDQRQGFQAALAACRRLGATLVAAPLDRIIRRAHTLSQLLEVGVASGGVQPHALRRRSVSLLRRPLFAPARSAPRTQAGGIRSFGIARNPPPPGSPPQIRPFASRSRHAVFNGSFDKPHGICFHGAEHFVFLGSIAVAGRNSPNGQSTAFPTPPRQPRSSFGLSCCTWAVA